MGNGRTSAVTAWALSSRFSTHTLQDSVVESFKRDSLRFTTVICLNVYWQGGASRNCSQQQNTRGIGGAGGAKSLGGEGKKQASFFGCWVRVLIGYRLYWVVRGNTRGEQGLTNAKVACASVERRHEEWCVG